MNWPVLKSGLWPSGHLRRMVLVSGNSIVAVSMGISRISLGIKFITRAEKLLNFQSASKFCRAKVFLDKLICRRNLKFVKSYGRKIDHAFLIVKKFEALYQDFAAKPNFTLPVYALPLHDTNASRLSVRYHGLDRDPLSAFGQ